MKLVFVYLEYEMLREDDIYLLAFCLRVLETE